MVERVPSDPSDAVSEAASLPAQESGSTAR